MSGIVFFSNTLTRRWLNSSCPHKMVSHTNCPHQNSPVFLLFANSCHRLVQHHHDRSCLSIHLNSKRRFLSTLKESEDENYLKNIHEKYEQERQSKQKKHDKWRKYSLPMVMSAIGLGVFYVGHEFGQPVRDSVTGVVFEDEFTGTGPFENIRRAAKTIRQDVKVGFQEPSREKLLPDPMKKPYIQPKYTLLIELKDVLVHPEWSFETGWRFRKRPGVDFLLETIAMPKYEVVVFTSEPAFVAAPVVDSLNKKGIVMYTLFRDSTHYQNNVYTKDITRINRDHSKVVIVDTEQAKVSPNPHNALVIPAWDGSMDDRSLYDLAMFLKAIDTTNCSDVRSFLKAYSKEEDPLETFRKRQLLLEQQAQKVAASRDRGSSAQNVSRGFFSKR